MSQRACHRPCDENRGSPVPAGDGAISTRGDLQLNERSPFGDANDVTAGHPVGGLGTNTAHDLDAGRSQLI